MRISLVLKLSAAVVIFTSLASAYSILVWDKDESDEYGGVASETGVMSSLTSLGESPTLHTSTSLPAEINGYDIVFVLTGWYTC